MGGLLEVLAAAFVGWCLIVMMVALVLSGFLVFSALRDLWQTGGRL